MKTNTLTLSLLLIFVSTATLQPLASPALGSSKAKQEITTSPAIFHLEGDTTPGPFLTSLRGQSVRIEETIQLMAKRTCPFSSDLRISDLLISIESSGGKIDAHSQVDPLNPSQMLTELSQPRTHFSFDLTCE